jgi:hypothetical protein
VPFSLTNNTPFASIQIKFSAASTSQREKVAALPGSFPATKEAVEHSNNLSVREVELHCTKTSTKNSRVFNRELPELFSGKLGIIRGNSGFCKGVCFSSN